MVTGAAVEQKADSLVPIELDYLKVGEEMKFPILQLADGSGQYVLLLNRNQKFTERLREAIESAADPRIYTKRRYIDDYESYVESRLEEMLADESIPIEKRSAFLYGEVSKIMENLFEGSPDGEISKESLDQASRYGNHLANFIRSNPRAMRSMMAITSKDYYTFTHSIHVCIYGLGLYLGTIGKTSMHSVNDVGVGLLLHDVGKAQIDASIIKKKGRLTEEEWETIKRHPMMGAKILKKNGFNETVIQEIARHHHERLNGRGYPDGLKGDHIPELARITGIVDAYDAMTTHRPYQKAMAPFEALSKLKEENKTGELFDPKLFHAFIKTIAGKIAGE